MCNVFLYEFLPPSTFSIYFFALLEYYKKMEDDFHSTVLTHTCDGKKIHTTFYGVFDGHRGDACAKYLVSTLAGAIRESPAFSTDVSQFKCGAILRWQPVAVIMVLLSSCDVLRVVRLYR